MRVKHRSASRALNTCKHNVIMSIIQCNLNKLMAPSASVQLAAISFPDKHCVGVCVCARAPTHLFGFHAPFGLCHVRSMQNFKVGPRALSHAKVTWHFHFGAKYNLLIAPEIIMWKMIDFYEPTTNFFFFFAEHSVGNSIILVKHLIWDRSVTQLMEQTAFYATLQ